MSAFAPAAVAIRGDWWRHAPLGGDPWYLPAVPASNRWQRGNVVPALYLADSPDTAWAEWEPCPPPERVDEPPAPPRGMRT